MFQCICLSYRYPGFEEKLLARSRFEELLHHSNPARKLSFSFPQSELCIHHQYLHLYILSPWLHFLAAKFEHYEKNWPRYMEPRSKYLDFPEEDFVAGLCPHERAYHSLVAVVWESRSRFPGMIFGDLKKHCLDPCFSIFCSILISARSRTSVGAVTFSSWWW
jgi:hypothetical protein